MAHPTQHIELPETPGEELPGAPPTSRGKVLRGAAVVAAAVAVAVLARLILAGGDDNQPARRAPATDPACVWTSDIGNTPVFPAEDLGGPPTPGAFLIFESCNGEWTGNIAWSSPGQRSG